MLSRVQVYMFGQTRSLCDYRHIREIGPPLHPKMLLSLLCTQALLHPQPWILTYPFFVYFCLFQCHIDEIIQCVDFCVWLLSPSRMHLNFTCAKAGVSSFSLLVPSHMSLCRYATVCLVIDQVKDICFQF